MSRTGWSVWGVMLAGLGAFGIVLALLFKFFLPGQAVKFPLNEYEVMTLRGTGVNYFNTTKLAELTGVTMQSTLTVKGDIAATNAARSSNIAVWQSFTATEDLTNHMPFNWSSQSLAFDRRTGELINCCGNVVNTNYHLHVSGQGYVWPFNAQRHGYTIFDTTALRPEPVRYAGTATLAGLTAYRYVETVVGQQIGTQTVPGSLVNMSAPNVTLPEIYSATNTFWVDPVTGKPLKLDQNQKLTLDDSGGSTRLVVFQGDMTTTPASVANFAASDSSSSSMINLIGNTLPLVIGIVGVVLLIAGIVLTVLRRAEEEDIYQDEPVPSTA